jgi:hypothetical protein
MKIQDWIVFRDGFQIENLLTMTNLFHYKTDISPVKTVSWLIWFRFRVQAVSIVTLTPTCCRPSPTFRAKSFSDHFLNWFPLGRPVQRLTLFFKIFFFQKFAFKLGVQTVAVFVMGYGCAQRSAREWIRTVLFYIHIGFCDREEKDATD